MSDIIEKKTTQLVIEKILLEDLHPHPENPRKHPESGTTEWELLKESLDHDYFDPIVFNKTNNLLVSGHLRVKILKDLGYESADCVIVNYDESTHKMRMLAANKLIGTDNVHTLNTILQEYKQTDLIKLCGYTVEEIKKIKTKVATQKHMKKRYEFGTSNIDKLNEIYKIKTGDIVELGKHKILCGDSCDEESYKKLLGEEKFSLLFSDPPYGIDLDGVTNDEKEKFVGLLTSAFKQADKYMERGSSFYIFFGDSNCHKLVPIIEEMNWHIQPPFIIWVKENHTFTRLDYHSETEQIIFGQKNPENIIHPLNAYDRDEFGKLVYGWKKGMPHHFVEDRKVTNIWCFARSKELCEFHPTAKPIELIRVAVGNSTYADEIVFDPFGGSMSTLFACQEIDRICRTIEITPQYVAGAIHRWIELYPEITPTINGEALCLKEQKVE